MYGERYASRASAEKPIQASVISSGCQLNSLDASLRYQCRCRVSCKHMMRPTRHATPGHADLFVSLLPAANPALTGLRLTPPKYPNTHVAIIIKTASCAANSRPRSTCRLVAGMATSCLGCACVSNASARLLPSFSSGSRSVVAPHAQLTSLNVMHAYDELRWQAGSGFVRTSSQQYVMLQVWHQQELRVSKACKMQMHFVNEGDHIPYTPPVIQFVIMLRCTHAPRLGTSRAEQVIRMHPRPATLQLKSTLCTMP
jgi:hypothetical protein